MLDIATCIVYIAGMKIQNQIKKTLSQPKAIEQINKMYEVVTQNESGHTQTFRLKNNQIQQDIFNMISVEF